MSLLLSGTGRASLRLQRQREGEDRTDVEEQAASPAGNTTEGSAGAGDGAGGGNPADGPAGQEIIAQAASQQQAAAEDDFVYADVLSFQGCQEAAWADPGLYRQILLGFITDWLNHPVPSAARKAADAAGRLPKEEIGLHVPQQPRPNNLSLYKLEQRLTLSRRLDQQALAAQLRAAAGEQVTTGVLVEQPVSAGPWMQHNIWLDEHGLMKQDAPAVKGDAERPYRRFDQNEEEVSRRWCGAVTQALAAGDAERTFRLDVSAGRCEFLLHPCMSREHQLAAALLRLFQEHQRRAAVGLASFYAAKLSALEDLLLDQREQLFEATEGGKPAAAVEELVNATAALEREVAEVRQLREEEDQLLLATLNAMGRVWAELLAARAAAGRQLTNVHFSVVQLPEQDDVPLQQDGMSRHQLDLALLIAEQEQIAGLPNWPSPFPAAEEDVDFSSSFALRRVEATATCHRLKREELRSRLKLLQERVSADPQDPDVLVLQQQLEELGPGPRRLVVSAVEEMQMRQRAKELLEQGQLGVFRPPRLQPRVTVSLLDDTADTAATTSSSNSARQRAGAGSTAVATGVQDQNTASLTKALLGGHDTSSTVGSGTGTGKLGGQQGLAPGAARFAGSLRYYCRLLVNGHVVGTTEAVSLKDDFTLDFRDVFSIRVYQWPKSVQLQLWQKGKVTDTQLSEVYVVVPGLHGCPHVDPLAKPYSWTCSAAVPRHRLARAAELAQAGIKPGNTMLGTLGQATQAGSESGSTRTMLHPSGVIHVRCGWVADQGVQDHFSPFSTAGGVTAVSKTLVESGPLVQTGVGGDGTVQLTIHKPFTTAAVAAAATGMGGDATLPGFTGSSPGRPGTLQQQQRDTLRLRDTMGSPSKGLGRTHAAMGATGKVTMYGNPLAELGGDLEAGTGRLMPKPPEANSVRALHQTANGKSQVHTPAGTLAVAAGAPGYSWLTSQLLDPNDPQNAALLELLKAQEAAGEVKAGQGLSDLFRLDTLAELAMAVDRGCDQRAAFLKQRWDIGPRVAGAAAARGDQRLMAPLVRQDEFSLPPVDMQGLAAAEAASWGVVGHQQLAEGAGVKWASGDLAKAVEERAAGLRSFSLKIRSALQRALGTGRQRSGMAFKTNSCVKETPLPDFKLDLASLTQLFQPVRPLRPPRVTVKKLQTLPAAERMRLVVVVQRATHLPKRLSHMGGVQQKTLGRHGSVVANNFTRTMGTVQLTATGNVMRPTAENLEATAAAAGPAAVQAGSGAPVLSCFVEASYRGYVDRTSSVDSDMPIWNQQLLFPLFDPDQPSSSDDLQNSSDYLTLSVFDEVLTAASAQRLQNLRRTAGSEDPILAATEALGEGGALPQKERRFLGSIRVPVAAIYQADLMQGSFKLEVPPVIVGYDQDSGRPPSLHVYITLRPRLMPPVTSSEELVSGESDEVVRHARKWVKNLLALPACRSRVVRAIAVDPEGVGSLLTRYLHPTPLPPSMALLVTQDSMSGEALDRAMLALARWVAAVPFLEDAALNRRRSDVWTSSSDFLSLSAGDGEEHAHLLAGYFLTLGQQAYVVLGTAITGASAAFVLTTGQPTPRQHQPNSQQQDGGGGGDASGPLQLPTGPHEQPLQLGTLSQLRLWNPLTGHCYPVKDPAGEMREAGTVYSTTNIWVNIQECGQPWDINWQLADPVAWRPFFGELLPHRELASLQSDPIYRDVKPRVYEELEACAEAAVRNALYDARSMVVTPPSNKLSRVLKQLLRELPTQLADIQAAGLAASVALADALGLLANSDALAGAEVLVNKRLGLIQTLQMSHQERIAREMRGCLVNGHVLAVPFSNDFAAAVREAVLHTGIHRTRDARVKFAMASFVEPLGHAFVCRCWIYVAAIRET